MVRKARQLIHTSGTRNIARGNAGFESLPCGGLKRVRLPGATMGHGFFFMRLHKGFQVHGVGRWVIANLPARGN